jgi:hypothetical protein
MIFKLFTHFHNNRPETTTAVHNASKPHKQQTFLGIQGRNDEKERGLSYGFKQETTGKRGIRATLISPCNAVQRRSGLGVGATRRVLCADDYMSRGCCSLLTHGRGKDGISN